MCNVAQISPLDCEENVFENFDDNWRRDDGGLANLLAQVLA